MIIEKASRGDIPHLVKFQRMMALETEDLELDTKIVTEGISQMFDDPLKGQYFVVRNLEDPIGCLMITYEWSDWRNGTVIWIQSVYVKPAFRKRGVFRKLYEYIRQMVNASEQYRGIRLYVEKANLRAQKVYQAMGMDGDHYQLYEWMK